MTATVVVTAICLIVVYVAVRRFATLRTAGPLAHYLSAALLCFGLGKLARTPVISDDWIDGWFHSWSGVWNITDLAGMSLGVAGAIFLVHAVAGIVGRPFPTWALPGTIAMAWASLGITFAMSPVPHAPTAFMTRDFPLTGWFAAYWLIYLTYLGIPSLNIAVLASKAAKVFRRGTAHTAVLSVAAAGFGGFLYVLHKVINLAAENFDVLPWYADNAPTISLLVLLPTLLIPAWGLLLILNAATQVRLARLSLLRSRLAEWEAVHAGDPDVALDRSLLPSRNSWALWKATQDPVTTNRMLIELADSATTSAPVESGRS
ncbi:hypothetical protein [Dietzia sp. 179-F 9C3 NHS]|uniref:hypothetical protein n=1 Tax=Dietzia sp. 179-F 9C3 NHS TaxID=3374295 RepID=UPI00387960C8